MTPPADGTGRFPVIPLGRTLTLRFTRPLAQLRVEAAERVLEFTTTPLWVVFLRRLNSICWAATEVHVANDIGEKKQDVKVEASAAFAAGSTLNAVARMKHSFSRQHLKAATYFANRADEIESATVASSDDERLAQHRAYVTEAVISAVAALESSINELYLEAQDQNPHTLKGLDSKTVSLLAEFGSEIERNPILHKYQIALLIIGAGKFDKGSPPYQETHSLIKLRDALVHYRPEWDDELDIHESIQKRLQGRFPENRLAQPGNLWFPHKCLGSGCAQWALNTATVFMREFCRRAQIPERF